MHRLILMILTFVVLSSFVACASSKPTKVTEETIEATATTLDFGDYTSTTLTNKAWEALVDEDYLEALAYTQECVRRYGEEGRRMNSEMSEFAPSGEASKMWAVNDVGTSLFIMGKAYAGLKMYDEAANAMEQLVEDFGYAQCWDPKGWYWRPAEVAKQLVEDYR